jgi:hypothetical protein
MLEDGQKVRNTIGVAGSVNRSYTKKMKKGQVCVRFDGPPVIINERLDAPFKAFAHYMEKDLEVVS